MGWELKIMAMAMAARDMLTRQGVCTHDEFADALVRATGELDQIEAQVDKNADGGENET